MRFEDWWEKNRPKTFSIGQLSAAKAAWIAATAAERQRCREIVKEVASKSSIIGIGVANQIEKKIGE